MIKPGDKVAVKIEHLDYGIEGRVLFSKPDSWHVDHKVLITEDKTGKTYLAKMFGRPSFVGMVFEYNADNLVVID